MTEEKTIRQIQKPQITENTDNIGLSQSNENDTAPFNSGLVVPQEARQLDEIELGRAVNAVLFAAGYPVEYDKLARIFARDKRDMRRFIHSHSLKFNELTLGLMILTFDDSVQMCTAEDYKDYVRQALGIKLSGKLSNSLLEVLAIVAYNQPCTKLFIENVRGVDSSYAISSLVERELIQAGERLDVPGRPLLYRTTDAFLRVFGINSLDELPKSENAKNNENSEISDDEVLKNFELKD